jgi:hypothetical protein
VSSALEMVSRVKRINPEYQDKRIKMEETTEKQVVGLVALRPNQPAQSGRSEWNEQTLRPIRTRRDGWEREPFHLLIRLPYPEYVDPLPLESQRYVAPRFLAAGDDAFQLLRGCAVKTY